MLPAFIASLSIVLSSQLAEAPDIAALVEVHYENKMISSGPNRPAIRLSRDNLQDILVLLHHGVGVDAIRSHF